MSETASESIADNYDTIPLRELEALVAVRFEGWRWFAAPTLGRCSPFLVGLWPGVDDGRFDRNNFPFNASDVTGQETDFKRFSDWDRQGIPKDRRSGMPMTCGFPRYATDDSEAMKLHRRLATGQEFYIVEVDSTAVPSRTALFWRVKITLYKREQRDETLIVEGYDETLFGAALCRALLRALDAKQEKGKAKR